MIDPRHPHDRLQDYLDDALSAEERAAVEAHLAACPACREEYAALRGLVAEVRALPRALAPPPDLWKGIEARLDVPAESPAARRNGLADRPPRTPREAARRRRVRGPVAAALVVVLAALVGVGLWLGEQALRPGWAVERIEGEARVDGGVLGEAGRLRVGQWLETTAGGRAALDVGRIGRLTVEPETRLQLKEARATDHRLVLAEGRIEAFIWAPPRLFFVETPSALAIDLGCAYTLDVDDDGASLLHVTAGYVELAHEGRTAVVPAGAMCRARPGQGPGTPFAEDATATFRAALDRFDLSADPAALDVVLAEARPEDALSLWYLLGRAGDPGRVYARLADLVPPPAGTTAEGVLGGDEDMRAAWEERLGLATWDWWRQGLDGLGPLPGDAVRAKKAKKKAPGQSVD